MLTSPHCTRTRVTGVTAITTAESPFSASQANFLPKWHSDVFKFWLKEFTQSRSADSDPIDPLYTWFLLYNNFKKSAGSNSTVYGLY